MLNEHDFDAAVNGFYRAATGAISWNDALTAVHEAFGTRATLLHSVDLRTGRLAQLVHGGPAHEGVLDYVRHWHEFDPRRTRLLEKPELMLNRWWHCHEHFDEAFAARDVFYRQFLPAQETRYMSTTADMVSHGLLTAFALEMPASRGPLNPDERHVLERLGRHVFDALRAYERVRHLAVQALVGHGLLDAFSHPMWLLDADRFIFYANTAAKVLRISDELIDVRDHHLMWRSQMIDRDFGILLQTLCNGRHGMRSILDARKVPSDPPIWLHLHALAPDRVLGAFGDRPQVLATLFDPQQMRELDPFALADIFGMTPTEAHVASLLGDGLTAAAIAEKLGSTVNTVRSHIRHVLRKLGATRLADAVRLLRQGDALWATPSGTNFTRP
jgi:DNA-binding CsgD family transcriptional regulator